MLELVWDMMKKNPSLQDTIGKSIGEFNEKINDFLILVNQASHPDNQTNRNEIEEMSTMAGSAIEVGSKKEETLEEEDGFYEPHI